MSPPLRTIGVMAEITGGWVRYGAEAAEALRGHIRAAKATEPLAPVTVIVPSNQVGVSVRRQLASGALGPVGGVGTGLIGVDFLTPYRLAELLGASALAAEGRRPVSTPVVSAAIRHVLRAEPGVFAPVVEHPATEAALVSSYRELRDLSEAALDALAARSDRAREVVRVCRGAHERLRPRWYDEEDLMAAATTVATQGGAAVAALGAVVVHLPQRLGRHATALLRAVGATGGLTVLAGGTGVAAADHEVSATLRGLGLDPEPGRFATSVLGAAVSPDRTRIITTSDADDEVRTAVRTVVDAVRGGTSLDRIAILHAAAEPYAHLLHDHLAAAGVPTNGAAEVPLVGRVASRALLGLLELPAGGYRREQVLGWLAGFPLRHNGRPVPTSAWERVSRSAGVVAGPDQWDQRLEDLAGALEAEAAEAAARPDLPAWRAERAQEEAARARDLRAFVVGLADQLAAAEAPQAWSRRVGWAKGLLVQLLGGAGPRSRWPDLERRAAERLELALDRLAALDDVEGPVPLDVFTRTLTVELEADLGRVGRFGEGVLVGPVSLGIGVDLDLVVLLGLAEGTFPTTARDDSLLPDDERRAAGGELPLRSTTVDRLHHQFLATVDGARRQVLCVPKGDLRRSRERVPSRWVLDVASELAGERWWSAELLRTPSTVGWLTHVASFDAGLRTLHEPATAQEHRLRQLLATTAAPGTDLRAVAVEVDPVLANGVHTLLERRRPALTRFDGNLAGLAIPSPIDRGTSATRLEGWARCPHAYLQQHLLRVEPVDLPEEALRITPIERGNLVHEVLEAFIKGELDRGQVPEPQEPWSTEAHQRLAALAEDACDRYERRGLTGQAIFWQRDRRRIIADLHTVLVTDDTRRRRTNSRPQAAELPFGVEGTAPVAFPLGDGRTVAVRGKADRVDLGDDGTLHVVDYKTGRSTKFKGLSEQDPHQGGRHLQLAVYAEAARQRYGTPHTPVVASYWFTSSREGFGELAYSVTPEVLAEVGGAMRAIVDGIEAGLFPPHPKPKDTSPFTDCIWCDPDELGTTEAVARWERKQADPVVAPYLALIAPPSEDPSA